MLRFSKEVPLIHLIDEDNKEVFYKLKNSIFGGLSLVFHKYHEKDKTKIQTGPSIPPEEWIHPPN